VEAGLQPPVAGDEVPAGPREPEAAARAAAGRLEEADAGGALQLAEIAPAVAIGHADAGERAAQRAQLVHQLEQARAPVAELHVVPEDDPHLHARLHRALLCHSAGADAGRSGGYTQTFARLRE